MEQVKLISLTSGKGDLLNRSPQEIITYVARVSNPLNQSNFNTSKKLLEYCIKNKHWSPFEHVYMTVEINTSRAIAQQIIRHRSFTFQEFSQRYSSPSEYINYPARKQDLKNRQNSLDTLPENIQLWFKLAQKEVWDFCLDLYSKSIEKGIAKECARFLLPLNTKTTLYMTGSIRSWIHYLELRTEASTQKEHKDIAKEIKKLFMENFSEISEALNWKE